MSEKKQYLAQVLIAEDNQTDAIMLEEMLKQFGCNVTVAHGLDITEKLEQQYDIILLDIRMPGINGMSIARNIRNSSLPIKDTAMLVVSSSEYDEEMKQQCMQHGVDGFIQKPIKEDTLAEVLGAFISEKEMHMFKDHNQPKGFFLKSGNM